MPSEIFPYLLLRSTALPLNYLEALHWPKSNAWEAILEKEAEQHLAQKDLLANLSKVIGKHPDYKAKNTLANLYKDIQKQRKLSTSKYQKFFDHSAAALAWFSDFENYKKQEQNIAAAHLQWALWYKKELPPIRRQLQKLLPVPALLNGLPLSSISIHHRLRTYLEKDIANHRKKEWQTERTALQFLSRVATKTSPFSSYTTLSIQALGSSTFSYQTQNSVRLNNYILSLLQEGLEQIPACYRQMNLKLNPSLRLENKSWKYILNSRNIESLQEIEAQDLLDLFLEKLQEGRKTFVQIREEALAFIEADAASIEAYLLQLIDLGLLEWEWGISGNEHHCLQQLKAFLNGLDDFSERSAVLEVLVFLEKQKAGLLRADAKERATLMKATEQKLIDFFQSFLKPADSSEEEKVFKRIRSDSFGFKAEKLFYEDQSAAVEMDLSKATLQPFLDKVDRLTECLHPLALSALQTEVWTHFQRVYPKEKQVDVLRFYDSFFRNRSKETFEDAIKNQEIDQIYEQLEEERNTQKGPVFNLSLERLEAILSVLSPGQVNAQKGKGQGALFHFFKNKEGTLQAYLEANFMGYGKMMGRFLHLFPEALTHKIRAWNKAMAGQESWVENVDASYFNANLHPRLLDLEIASPGSQNILGADQQLAVIDLEIVKEETRNLLLLRHKPSQKEVLVFNFGFEAMASRSSMYQLLQSFGPQNASLDILTNLIDQVVLEKWSDGVLFLPRLVIDHCLVLKRKRWYFPSKLLPVLKTGPDQDAVFFLAIQRWRECWKLPNAFFLSLQPLNIPGEASKQDESNARKSDDYKPQYICLDNPLLVQLFGRLLRKVDGLILLEEMLPAESMEKEGRAVEVLVEWKKV